ncbi:hypothetical protein [Caulobacter sp. LARHSG274]
MVCCRTEAPRDGGYASAAALAVSLAVAILAAALVLRGVSALKLARADLRRSQAAYALSGAQVLAATRLVNGARSARLAWSIGGLDDRGVSVLAEAEAPKLRLTEAARLDDKVLALLGADDPAGARAHLAVLDARTATPDAIAAADVGASWRACARSAISPWGVAEALSLAAAQAPDQDLDGPRAGQVWRVRATTVDGWTDERIVRLIGRVEKPGAVIWRRFGRTADGGVTCDRTINSRASGLAGTPATP